MKQSDFESNICHEIIEAFKLEDMMRAFSCDVDNIKTYLLKYIPDEIDRKRMLFQYESLITLMKRDGVEESGHTKGTLLLIEALKTFDREIAVDLPDYSIWYDAAKPFIDRHREQAKGRTLDDIDICLNACYGLLLLKLDQSPVTEGMQEAVSTMGQFLAFLGNAMKTQSS